MSNKKLNTRLDSIFDEIKQADDEESSPTPIPAPITKQPKKKAKATEQILSPAKLSQQVDKVIRNAPPGVTRALVSPFEESNTTLTLPFKQGESWSTIELSDEDRDGWLDEEKSLVRQVVDQLNLALQNAYLFKETEQQNAELAILNQMAADLSSLTNLTGVTDIVYSYTAQLMDVASFFVGMYHPENKELSFPTFYANDEKSNQERRSIGNGLVSWIIENQKSLLLTDNVTERSAKLGLEIITIADNLPTQCWLGVPMIIDQKILGVIVVQSTTTPNLYTTRHQDLLQAIAGQAAIAIQNANLFEQTEQQNTELAILNQMGTELSSLTNMDAVTDIVYKYTGQLMDVTDFFVALYHPETQEISFPLVYFSGKQSSNEKVAIGNGFSAWIVNNRKSLLLPDNVDKRANELGIKSLSIGTDDETHSWLGAPMILGQDILGIISVQSSTTPNLYTTHHKDLLEAIAGQAAIALQNAKLFEQTQQQNAELAILNQMAVEFSTLSSLEKVAEIVYSYTGRLMDVNDFFVGIYHPEAKEVSFPAAYFSNKKVDQQRLPMGNGLSAWVMNNQKPLLLADKVSERAKELGVEVLTIANDDPTVSWLGVPMVLNQEILGLICVQSSTTPNLYNQRHQDLLQAIAGQAAIAIQNSRLYEQEQYRRQIADTMSEMARISSATLDIEQVTHSLLAELPKLLNFHTASIQFINPDGSRVQAGGISMHQDRQSDLEHPAQHFLRPVDDDPLISEIVNNKKTVIISNTHNDSRWEVLSATQHIHSWLGAPLMVGKSVIGVLILDDEDANTYTNESIPLAEAFCAQAAVAVQNARLFAETQASEENFRNLIENAPEAILVLNLQKGFFEDPNENAALLFNIPINEFTKTQFSQVLPITQSDGKNSLKTLNEYLEITQKGETPSFDLEIINKKSEIIPCEFHLSRIPGESPRIRATVIDITERKRAQEAIQKSEETLRRQNEYLATATEVSRLVSSTLDMPTLFSRAVNLIRSSFDYYHVAIFTLDESGYTAVVREATGETGEKMRDKKQSLVVGSKSIIGSVTSSGQTIIANNTALDPVYKMDPLLPETRSEATIPLKIGQRIIGALDIQSTQVGAFQPNDIAVLETLADQISVAINNAELYDISQQAVDQMRETDRIKTQFLANMSHELRTPLNSIIGFSRVILKGIDGPINEQQQQDLTAIYNSGQHLLGLINDILDLSKIEAGKFELALDEVNILDTVSSVLSTAAGLVKDKPIRLEKNIPANIPTLRADAIRIRQVLINLMSNAAKFTDEGIVTVSAEAHITNEGFHEVLISITDTGPGIALDDQNKLFQAFSQVDSSPTRASGGTGLGLSICRAMVELHGGRIGVHSVVGKGSTFYFTIPAFVQPNAIVPELNGKIIACIDDDTQVTGLYTRYLQPHGYEVVAITNPLTAKDTIKRMQPYAITLDIMMPGIDGWNILEQLKNDPDTRAIPVIICSIVEEEEKGFSLGASDYLVKPIMEEDISRSLKRLNGDGSIKHVLVIDDSPEDLKLIKKILSEDERYTIQIANGGLAGWEILASDQPPHAVVLDLFMPELNGFEIIERMRSLANLRDIPVIVVSGAELTPLQKGQLDNLGKRLLQKAMLSEKELFASLEKALKRMDTGNFFPTEK